MTSDEPFVGGTVSSYFNISRKDRIVDRVDREFDAWGKTINRTMWIGLVGVVIGFITTMVLTWRYDFNFFINLAPVTVFCLGSLFYVLVIGERKIRAHQRRIDDLSRY